MVAEQQSTRAGPKLLRLGPPVAAAVSVSGFWLYLGLLDILSVEPRTSITATYYALLAVVLVLFAWRGRRRARQRLLERTLVERLWLAAAAALVVWFALNAALFSSGVVARDAVALLVVSSVPTAALILTLTWAQLRVFWISLVALGIAFAVVLAASLALVSSPQGRFTPIAQFDPISASRVLAIAACLFLLWRPDTRRRRVFQLAGAALLVAATIVPGSRSALVALGVGIAVVAAIERRRLWPTRVAAVLAGIALGVAGSNVVGSDYYYSLDVPGLEGRVDPPNAEFREHYRPEPISSLAIRRNLMEKALRTSPDRPLFGHGVGMLVADGPEVTRMVRAGRMPPGQKTYPHNVLIEALHSLGLLGLALLLALAGAAIAILVRALRGGALPALPALVFAALAATNAMLSGALGSDVDVWVALALPLAAARSSRFGNDEAGIDT